MEAANRFKGLDLVSRVPEELWTEVRNIVQEAVNKTKEKEKQEGKVVIEGAITNSLKKKREREAKSKGKMERYIQLNAEFQRTWKYKKAFFNEQCIKLEENNRRAKTRDLFRKTGNIK